MDLKINMPPFAFVYHLPSRLSSSVAHSAHPASCYQEAWNLDVSSEARGIILRSHGSPSLWLYPAPVSTAAAERESEIGRQRGSQQRLEGYKVADWTAPKKEPVLTAWHSTSVLQSLKEDNQFPAVATLAHQSTARRQGESVRVQDEFNRWLDNFSVDVQSSSH